MYSRFDELVNKARALQRVKTLKEVLANNEDLANRYKTNPASPKVIDDIIFDIVTNYSVEDPWKGSLWNDDSLYISLTNEQHQGILDYQNGTTDKLPIRGMSGCFADEATVKAAMVRNVLDNTKYNKLTQIQIYADEKHGEYSFKPHIDKFIIDRDKLFEEYGTRDLAVASSITISNDTFSRGGGNEGYIDNIEELIEKKILILYPYESFSRIFDSDDDRSKFSSNKNVMINSLVTKEDFNLQNKGNIERVSDCFKNNIIHPSDKVIVSTRAQDEQAQMECNSGHNTPCEFLESFEKNVDGILNYSKSIDKNTLDALEYSIFKNLKIYCPYEKNSEDITQTYAYRFLNNDYVKKNLQKLADSGNLKDFNTEDFLKKIAERYYEPIEVSKSFEEYKKDLQVSGIKAYNHKLDDSYSNLMQNTNVAFSLQEIADISKCKVPELRDEDICDIANECYTQQHTKNLGVDERE